jgi:hypothetical protein
MPVSVKVLLVTQGAATVTVVAVTISHASVAGVVIIATHSHLNANKTHKRKRAHVNTLHTYMHATAHIAVAQWFPTQ